MTENQTEIIPKITTIIKDENGAPLRHRLFEINHLIATENGVSLKSMEIKKQPDGLVEISVFHEGISISFDLDQDHLNHMIDSMMKFQEVNYA